MKIRPDAEQHLSGTQTTGEVASASPAMPTEGTAERQICARNFELQPARLQEGGELRSEGGGVTRGGKSERDGETVSVIQVRGGYRMVVKGRRVQNTTCGDGFLGKDTLADYKLAWGGGRSVLSDGRHKSGILYLSVGKNTTQWWWRNLWPPTIDPQERQVLAQTRITLTDGLTGNPFSVIAAHATLTLTAFVSRHFVRLHNYARASIV
ncbi:hypothetical protein J6590_044676 [Homalodisca vitripennis]|nr:hypothetical protein J6590_044676 [Homalodisca vitripennis]